MAKLEGKIKDLEAELASTQSRTGEASKAFQRAERKAKELSFAQGEDKKNQDRMSELATKLQQKIKTYKKQIEEAEEIAALNLAKFRQVGPTEPFPIFSYTKDCKLSTRSKQHWEQASRGLI